MGRGTLPNAGSRRHALDDRRFRSLLLALAGLPVGGFYVWRGLVEPLWKGEGLGDFRESYLPAAARLAAGHDPYDLTLALYSSVPSGPWYAQPPLMAWALQPLLGWPEPAQEWLVILSAQLSLALFLVCLYRALRVRDWQLRALLALAAVSFQPVLANIFEGQVNLVLLGLSGVFLLAWVEGDRWWGGAALAAGVSLKLLQSPSVLLVFWGRRWRMLAAGAVTGLLLAAIAAPQYLPGYLLRVLPAISGGTGFFENHSPGGTIARLLVPASFFGQVRGNTPPVAVLTVLLALGALAVTAWTLRAPSGLRWPRALEVAAAVAVGPLVASYSWGTHMVLLLLPMLVLLAWSIRRSNWPVFALVAAGWFLLGPMQVVFENALQGGVRDYLLLRLLAEHGVLGVTAVWAAALLANRADAADQHRAQQQEEDRAREDHAVA